MLTRHPLCLCPTICPLQAGVVLPGMFFVYDVAPFLVEIKRVTVPLSHLLTRLCAIVGGVFSVMGVLDAVCFRLQKMRSTVI